MGKPQRPRPRVVKAGMKILKAGMKILKAGMKIILKVVM